MKKEIEERIREVHPTGIFSEMNREAFLSPEFDQKVFETCIKIKNMLGFEIAKDSDWESKRTWVFTINHKNDPPFNEWLSYTNEYRIHWIRTRGMNYPVLFLCISRVWPAYEYYYNIWKPREDTGYLDTEIIYEPFNADWEPLFKIGFPMFENQGIIQLSKEELKETVPFVHEEDWSYLDEPGNENIDWDEAKPELVETNVNTCLFWNH